MKRPSPRRGGGSRIGSVAGTLAAGVPALISFTLASHCAVDRAPAGARLTPLGAGPTVVFDLQALPLPNIPQPNDVATFPDPTSRTGRRINVSTVSPTQMETFARQGFGEMEGWGTFAPITVGFQKEDGVNPTLPALDLADLRARMQNDGHDMTNDPVYVINLTTGVPVMLDMGDGNFSYTPRDLDLYFPNDPKIAQQNLLFETVEEGAGLTQSNYAPQLDLDFDGVLDHPDNLAPLPPGGIEGIDDLTGYYERETDTLILRPLLPMEEKTEYAVVVTDRLHGPSGHVAKSPFEYVNHPEQNADVARAVSILSDSSRTNYYGDIAGSGAQHIAFAWTFTTAPTYEDLRLLRDGLYGRGPFAYVGTRFPAKAEAIRAVGLATSPADEQIDLRTQAQCKPVLGQPYAVNVAASEETIDQIVQIVLKASFSLTPSQELFLENELQSIDHFVIGTFQAPYYLSADPTHESPDRPGARGVRHGAVLPRRSESDARLRAAVPHGRMVARHVAVLGRVDRARRLLREARDGDDGHRHAGARSLPVPEHPRRRADPPGGELLRGVAQRAHGEPRLRPQRRWRPRFRRLPVDQPRLPQPRLHPAVGARPDPDDAHHSLVRREEPE